MAAPSNKKRKIFAAVCIVIAVSLATLLVLKHFTGNKIYALESTGIADVSQITLISHRGMSSVAPENTLEAAEQAAAYGYTHIEFDIRQTKDGVWVVLHDDSINRTTNGSGKISNLTYKQIFEYRVDEIDGKSVYIPSLSEMLNLCNNLGLHPVIEIKQEGTDFITQLVQSVGYIVSECTFITFDREQTEMISEILSSGEKSLTHENTELYWLVKDLSDQTLETAKSDTLIGVSFKGNKAGTPDEIKKFTDAGLPLATWTIDSPERLAELYALGITTFTTNIIAPKAVPEVTTDEVTRDGRR